MADRVQVSWRGRSYEAVRQTGREAQPDPAPVWQVTHEGAPVTSFPAEPNDDAGQVREKVVEWLEGNETRPSQDIGRQ